MSTPVIILSGTLAVQAGEFTGMTKYVRRNGPARAIYALIVVIFKSSIVTAHRIGATICWPETWAIGSRRRYEIDALAGWDQRSSGAVDVRLTNDSPVRFPRKSGDARCVGPRFGDCRL